MNYAELFDLFHKSINRNPKMPDDLAQRFINFGIKRIEKRLTLDIQIKTQTVAAIADNTFPIPADVMSFVKIYDENGVIPRVSDQTTPGRGFYTSGNTITTIHDTAQITIEYYSTYTKSLPSNSTSTEFTDIDDLVLYAALIYAAEHFVDERLSNYTNTFETLIAEYDLAQRKKNFSGNLVIRNPYGDYF